MDRDPACSSYLQIMLFFKGFQAIQAQRIGHHLWTRGRTSLAHALQSRVSQVFDVDVHPGAYLGRGIMFDHATGIVIGETAVIGDNVAMLHRVTIGGSGNETGIRHPTIGHGVLLGAGVSVLGPISVGHDSKIGACSVVVQSVPEKSVAVGVPAKVVKQDKFMEPCKDMDSAGDFVLDFVI
jgi:serine O-acetyltransferase